MRKAISQSLSPFWRHFLVLIYLEKMILYMISNYSIIILILENISDCLCLLTCGIKRGLKNTLFSQIIWKFCFEIDFMKPIVRSVHQFEADYLDFRNGVSGLNERKPKMKFIYCILINDHACDNYRNRRDHIGTNKEVLTEPVFRKMRTVLRCSRNRFEGWTERHFPDQNFPTAY